MERLQTEPELKELVSQFVALELDKDSADFRQWSRMFPPNGDGIPMVYIVSAQGQEFYNESGAPQGEGLTRLLQTGIRSATEANEALEAERLAQVGQPDEEEADDPEPEEPATSPARPPRRPITPSSSDEPESMGDKLRRADSFLRMARVFSESSPEKARDYAQRIIDLVPDSSQARDARRLIGELD